MQNQRKHKRFKLRLINIESKVNLVGKVDVVDMSPSGVLLTTEGKLAIGRECSIQFGYRGIQYPVKGMVIQSELSGIDERSPNKSVTRYLVGIVFKDESAGKVKEFLDSIEQSKKVEMPATANWRFRDVQFNLTTPNEKVLDFPAQFTIQDITQKRRHHESMISTVASGGNIALAWIAELTVPDNFDEMRMDKFGNPGQVGFYIFLGICLSLPAMWTA